MNGLWVYAWINEQLVLSMIIMIFLLTSLIRLTFNLRLETWNAPWRIIAFVWWPICIYTGWIVLATVVNAAVVIKSLGLLEGVMTPVVWTLYGAGK